MGIVANQSIKNVVSTYVGFGLGALNVLFLYPKFLTPEYYGLVTFLLSAGNLIWPFMSLGVHNTVIKYFSSYSNTFERDRLLSFALFFPLLLGLFFGVLGYFSYDYILNYFEGQNDLVQPYAWTILIIGIVTAYFEVFFAWTKVQFQSVFGTIMREVFHRLGITLLLLALYFDLLTVNTFIYGVLAVYVFRTLVLMIYAFRLYLPKFSWQLPPNFKDVMQYSSLIFVAGTIAVALFDMDKVMIEYFLPIENVSIYGIAIYIATVIAVPSKAMHQITNPITAKLLNTKSITDLKDLYIRSSNTLFLISGLIFILIVTNIEMLYQLIPEDYRAGVSIVFLISLVKLSDNFLGNNNSIIFNSKYYKTILLAGILIVVLAFLLNIWLIPEFGIYGAAYASFSAFLAFNIFKLLFVYLKFKIHPINFKSLMILLSISGMTLVFYFWDFTWHPIFNIITKSLIISLMYIFLTLSMNLSQDISDIYRKLFQKKTP
ncbi:oligosaccharide flippase family protein [Psychroflexus aestuariivivens]|uniref:oligosaccharide flippase family protein n=1 Tax=Psychroflexus aestuariivivens TaxID=1795040 RepID=UPI000FD8228B|nr:oligosaccharide flippase family protein [Psychroflexus aestuariivivens]